MFSQIEKGFSKIQSPPNTISHSPKDFKPNQAKSVREKKDGLAFKIWRTVISVLVE